MNGTLRPAFDLAGTLDTISGFMYTYLLVALLIGVGLYFFVRTDKINRSFDVAVFIILAALLAVCIEGIQMCIRDRY